MKRILITIMCFVLILPLVVGASNADEQLFTAGIYSGESEGLVVN